MTLSVFMYSVWKVRTPFYTMKGTGDLTTRKNLKSPNVIKALLVEKGYTQEVRFLYSILLLVIEETMKN